MSTLSNKVALVTGGSRGIGAAIAKRLAADGAAVAITYTRGKEPADAIVKAITTAGGKAIALQADAADPAAVRKSVEDTVKQFGQLDILVNNAGIGIFKPIEETSVEDIDKMFDVNVRGYIVATQAALKHLKKGGRIINIGSCVGERVAFGGLTVYAATKGAIKMLTQGLSRELGPRGITVNAIGPGPIDTDANPADGPAAEPQKALISLGRYGHVDEIAGLVSYLAGPESSFVNSSSFVVDGGLNA